MSFLRVTLVTLSLLILSQSTVLAQDSADDVDCNNAISQKDMNFCARQAYEAADGDLNADYQMAIDYFRNLDEELTEDLKGGEEALRKAQRAWIKYRDLTCEQERYQVRGGTMEPLIFLMCLERLTRARSEDLRIQFEEN